MTENLARSLLEGHVFSDWVASHLGAVVQATHNKYTCGVGKTPRSIECLSAKTRLIAQEQTVTGLAVIGARATEHVALNTLDAIGIILDPQHFGDRYRHLVGRNVETARSVLVELLTGFVAPFAAVKTCWERPAPSSFDEESLINDVISHRLAALNLVGLGELSWSTSGVVHASGPTVFNAAVSSGDQFAAWLLSGGQLNRLAAESAGLGGGQMILGGALGAEGVGTLVGVGLPQDSLSIIFSTHLRSVGDEGTGSGTDPLETFYQRLSPEQTACLKRLFGENPYEFRATPEMLDEIRRLFPEPPQGLPVNEWTPEHWVRVVMEDGSELGVGWQNTTLKLVDDIFLHPEWKQQTITWDGIMKRLQTTSHPGDLNNYFPQLSGTYMFRSPYAVAWRRLNPQQFVEVSEGWKVAKSIGQVRAAELAEKEAALTAEPAPFWGRPSQPYVERMRASFQWYERARNILQEIIEDPQYRGLVDPISKKNPFDC